MSQLFSDTIAEIEKSAEQALLCSHFVKIK